MIKWYLIREINQGEKPVVAVDIGGTKMLIAVINPGGQSVVRQTLPTQAAEGPEAVVSRLIEGIDGLLEQNDLRPSQLSGISLATAGIIDVRNGIVTDSPNLPGWKNIPLRNIITQKYRLPAYLLNDADAAALGEHRFGAGRGHDNIIMLTLGTGIGGGIIIDGKLFIGSKGSAAEIGHMVVLENGPECACGNHGCLESLSSGTAIAVEAKSRLRQGQPSLLSEVVSGRVENVTAETVHLAARNGDELANEVIARSAYYLGVGVTNLVNLFNPEVVIFGGSMAEMGDLLLGPVSQIVAERAFPLLAASTRFVTAGLGNDAGIYGASVYASEQ